MATVIIPLLPESRDPEVWNTLADAVEAVTFGAGAIAREGLDACNFVRGSVSRRLGGSRQATPTILGLTTSWAEPNLSGRPWTGATGPHSVPAGSVVRVRGSIAFETDHGASGSTNYGLPASGTVTARLVSSVGGVQTPIPGAVAQLSGALRGPPTAAQTAQGAHGSIILEGWSSVASVDYYALEIKGSGTFNVRVGALAISARLFTGVS